MEAAKQQVKDFWNDASCGENLYLKGEDEIAQFNNQLKVRYELEPFILPFAEFEKFKGKKVLEIGVGLGADHQMWAQSGAIMSGCDLTERAVEHTSRRMKLLNLQSELRTADAENLPYADASFDAVYSWGVIHHSPNTPKAASEIYRVLKPGGEARVMIYHKHSMVGYMLWLRYGLLAVKPARSLNYIYSHYLESPGTKAYTVKEAQQLFKQFSKVEIDTLLGHGDLLTSKAGQRHEGALLNIARKVFPRFFIRTFLPKHGLFMLVKLVK
jgi:Methylase involved in ubiquinone/menaquinone biosynthesis